jgi:hypothetical protein
MQIKKDLELVEVNRNEKNTNLELLYLDQETGKIYTVKFNKQKWNKDTKKFEDNLEKTIQVDEWLIDALGVTFDSADTAIGTTHDVYVYADRERPFNSLWESTSLSKPDDAFAKKYRGGANTVIDEVINTGSKIQVRFTIDGEKYGSSNSVDGGKLNFSDWINSREQYFPNALKEKQAFENFESIFGIPFEDKDSLIGKAITVYPQKAGRNLYLEFELTED